MQCQDVHIMIRLLAGGDVWHVLCDQEEMLLLTQKLQYRFVVDPSLTSTGRAKGCCCSCARVQALLTFKHFANPLIKFSWSRWWNATYDVTCLQ